MPHTPHPPFFAVAGSRQPKILFIGEAWGESEDSYRKPFVGESGKEFFRMLTDAWPDQSPELAIEIRRLHKYGFAWINKREEYFHEAKIAFTNVFAFRPQDNNIESLCGSKKEVGGAEYTLPPIKQGKYIKPEFLSELDRLREEITVLRPNLIVALGGTASWALLHSAAIGSIRGAIAEGFTKGPGEGVKTLPTYHPAGVLRNWSWRPIVVGDLIKAKREAEFKEIRRPARSILINPTIEEVENWAEETLRSPPAWVSPDVETAYGQIRIFGFARSRSDALVIPFIDQEKPGWNYWDSIDHELRAWSAIKRLLNSPIIKCGQNFIYDLQYCLPIHLFDKTNHDLGLTEDTMLLHHSLFPELQKGLGFLGSVYTNEVAWKLMRKYTPDTEKRDE